MQIHRERLNYWFGAALASMQVMLTAGCGSDGLDSIAPMAEETMPPPAELIFEEAYSETGRIRVYRGPDGQIGLGVIGGIEHDDATVVRQYLSRSVVQLHRNLRPGAPVPARLFEVDDELARSLTVAPAAPTAPASPLLAAPGESPDVGNFIATACQQFLVNSGSGVMYPVECDYSYVTGQLTTTFNHCPACGDWSFAWNVDNPHTTAMWTLTGSCSLSVTYYVEANRWGYYTWPPQVCNGRVTMFDLGYPSVFNLGVTIHRYAVNPPH